MNLSAPPRPSPKVTVPQIAASKPGGRRITMLTAYDTPTARLMDQIDELDIILVGDSLGNAELGYDSTVPVTMDDMVHHAAAVRRGVQRALVVVDMPFMSYQISEADALRNAARLMQEGGANAVKLEGGRSAQATIRRLVECGIPVMGHVGLRPQSVNLTGLKVQGRTDVEARQVEDDALAVQEAGAFAVVLELLPASLAERMTKSLAIPTIGIGSGAHCNGQVLVGADMLGLNGGRALKHVKQYAQIGETIRAAVADYCRDVQSGDFPSDGQSFR